MHQPFRPLATIPFLPDNGELSALIKNHDWSHTSIGEPAHWPQSLRTTLSILLTSKFPTVLFWGPDLVCFYNDAFRPSLGTAGKHPRSLGRKGEEMWAEIWPVIKPWLDQVLSGGESIMMENQLVPFYRNGRMEDIYWTFCYNAVFDESGKPGGVFVTCTETSVIEDSRLREQLAIEVSRLGVFEVDLATNTLISSARLDEIFGFNHKATREEFVSVIHPDDLERRQQAHAAALKTGSLRYEGRIILKDGSIRWMRSWGTITYDAKGTPAKLIGVTEDITDEKTFEEELNRKVAERTIELQLKNAQLEQSNQKLEEFAHAASHDLKEPIRKMHYFIDRLKTQLGDRLLEQELLTFEKMEASAVRMAALVDDLLQYSHLSQVPIEKEEVDLGRKVSFVLEDLELDIRSKNATIQVEPLPVVLGYRRQLQQLFQNLIANALKYSRSDTDPKISIRSKVIDASSYAHLFGEADKMNYHMIEVADNGLGFDQQYAEHLFKVFYRLHNRSDFKGNGIGLAIAKKVIDNHQGKIIAEGKLNEGAVFRIFLPIHET